MVRCKDRDPTESENPQPTTLNIETRNNFGAATPKLMRVFCAALGERLLGWNDAGSAALTLLPSRRYRRQYAAESIRIRMRRNVMLKGRLRYFTRLHYTDITIGETGQRLNGCLLWAV